MKNLCSNVVFLCIGAMLINTHIYSETVNTLELPELIISNSRYQERRAEAPLSISILSQEDLENIQVNSLDQVLNHVPGVYVSDLGNEQHFMSIRQPISTKGYFLYLEDGIPIRPTGVFNHNALLEVNMAGLKRIEVIRGPSSSLYGSEAVGGAINFITQSPTTKPKGKIHLRLNNLGYRRIDGYHSNTEDSIGYAVGGYYAERSNGPRDHSDYEKLAFNGKVRASFLNEVSMTASLGYIDYRSDMTGNLDSINYANQHVTSFQKFTERSVDALRGRITMDINWSLHSITKLTAFYRGSMIGQIPSYRIQDDYKPWVRTGDKNLAHGEINLNKVEGVGSLIQQLQIFPDINLQMISGFHIERSSNKFKANYIEIEKDSSTGKYIEYHETDSIKTNYDTDLINVASYTQWKWSLTEQIHITSSLRYDYFNYNYTNFISNDESPKIVTSFQNFSPKIGINFERYMGLFHFGSYGNISQGFSPPQVNELYRSNGNPHLKPAIFNNYEIGSWVSSGSWIFLAGSVYYIKGTNEIISIVLDDGDQQNQNAGKTSHVGIEWNIEASPTSQLALRINGSYAIHTYNDFTIIQSMQGQSKNIHYDGNRMDRAPYLIMNSSIEITPEIFKGFSVNLEWQAVGEYWMDPANTKKYEGYDLFHIRMGWKIGKMKFWFNILNFLDVHYATSANISPWGARYHLGEERSLNFGLTYSFNEVDW